MGEKESLIKTSEGEMYAFSAWPAENGPHPVVIMYMDAPGIREELKNFARRFASMGYYTLLPDLYYRLGDIRFNLKNRNDKMGEMIFAAWHSLSNDLVANDTSAMLDFLSDDPNASDGPMGCVGYCMSGAFVVTVAGSFPDRFSAIASLYGVWIVTDKDDSPHLLADKFKGEFYLAFAEHDQWVGDNVIPDLQNALTKNEIKHEIETFPGTEHGYSFPERDVYNEGAAEATWKKIENLYARVLG
ncbi:MAG: dienelactone hydrolase family protein [Alphaproteobacteria bacterium]|nr:dienelactone hydrolase family protein [Alphaproteobacteria bacterium]